VFESVADKAIAISNVSNGCNEVRNLQKVVFNSMSIPKVSEKNSMPALSVKNVSKHVALDGRSLEILTGIGLEIKQGESVAIVGRSGSGKTTLLGLMAGLDTTSAGTIELMGHQLENLTEDERAELRAQYIGFVFQSFHLLPGLTAVENVMLPLELLKQEGAEEKAVELLNSLGLGEQLSHYPQQLSGGEQQRVALARAVIARPTILFADEPTGNLDSSTGAEIIELLFEYNDRLNTTLVLVTHDEALANKCQRQVLIKDGKLVDRHSSSSESDNDEAVAEEVLEGSTS